MGMTPGWIMVAAGSLGGIACVLFLVSTIGRFRRQRKHLLEEISRENQTVGNSDREKGGSR